MKELLVTSVDLEAPAEFVFSFTSDLSYAKQWSVIFDHIVDLPRNDFWGDDDPQLGCRRRCYRSGDRRGYYLDEEVVAYVPNRLRRIYTYNTGNVAFPYNVLPIEAYTDNIFEPLSDTSSRYTFRSYLLRFNDPVSVFLFNYSPGGRGLLEPTFNQNLNNMKAMCEALYRDQEPRVPHGFWTHRTALDRPPDKLVEAPPPDEVGPRLGRYSNCHIELREKYPLPEFNV